MLALDVGLLGHFLGLQSHTLLDGNDVFTVFNEALTQQFVLQEMTANVGVKIYYYTNNRGASEIEFVVDDGARIIPIEVSGELNLQAKSLKVYCEKYNPEIAVRVNLGEYGKENGVINVPVYLLKVGVILLNFYSFRQHSVKITPSKEIIEKLAIRIWARNTNSSLKRQGSILSTQKQK